MMLACLLIILGAGALAAMVAARWRPAACRSIALAAVLADLGIMLGIWVRGGGTRAVDLAWIGQFGIHFRLEIDGLSLLLLLLTFLLGAIAVLASWREITRSVGFFHCNLLLTLAGIAGVFLARDLFLFYFAWELMLVPTYFLIAVWGQQKRGPAAVKYFLFTQIGGLLMLVAILSLYFIHHRETGVYTFSYPELLGTALAPATEMWIMLGFFIGFAVKLPALGLHSWLPDAQMEAPTAANLTGLMLEVGAYGMLRFLLPLFPRAARSFAPVAMAVGVAGILYGAMLAFSQNDFKRLLAYGSVSHLGFVLLGIFVKNNLALQGALVLMIAQGLSVGGLFVVAGVLRERIETSDLARMGGLWTTVPRLSGSGLLFALALLGLPGLGDFVGEFLVLLGTWQRSIPAAVFAALGGIAAAIYALRLVQAAFHGPNEYNWRFADLVPREGLAVGAMVAILLWLGLYPQPVIATFQPVARALQNMQTAALSGLQAKPPVPPRFARR
ncbi:MAG TPA: NADH-quinone oxidoreductase subunit M [Bryobacteraceae bacterium]|nr:NADH-quinone oxidoreductase subunit M [Bryobacteraceae bacterium]